ncbi:lipid droplet-associated hydrolase-like [Amblyomma americanum]
METKSASKVRYSYVTVNSVPTKVVEVGDTDLGPDSQEPLFVLIPGNPGIIEYYEDFLVEIYDEFDGRVHVCGLSHAGHDEVWTKCSAPSPKEHWHLYGLQGQVRHKVEFIKTHVNSNRTVYLAGHSIGAYMVLQILKELKGLNVKRSFMLFPVFERLDEAPNAWRLVWDSYLLKLVTRLLVFLLLLLPDSFKAALVSLYCRRLPLAIQERSAKATRMVFMPTVFQLMTDMAHEEICVLKERDNTLIGTHLQRLTFYYGSEDGWCPIRFYWDMQAAFPNADLTLCSLKLKHAFVLDRTADIASFIADKVKNST